MICEATCSRLREAPGTAFERLTTFTYTAAFNQIKTITDPNQNTLPAAERKATTFDYDANGNLIESIDENGTKTTLEYGDPSCPGLATLVTTASLEPEEATATNTYDTSSCNLAETRDPLQTLDPLRNPTVFDYDAAGNVIKITDSLLRETRFVYDAMNRVIKEIDATNGPGRPTLRHARHDLLRLRRGGQPGRTDRR